MKNVESPAALAKELTSMFPQFAIELEGKDPASYHEVLGYLAPVIAGYLEVAPDQVARFCGLINAMVEAGAEKENAISTCLLEHASQVQVRSIIRPHLSAAAKRELR